MRHLIRLVLVLVFALAAVPAFAQQTTASCAIKGDYLGADGAIFYDGKVLQCDTSHSWKKGFFLGIWASTAGNTALEFDKEVDLFGGYNGKVGKARYTIDVAHFAIQGIDVANANVEMGLGPAFVRLEGYVPVQKGGPRKGLIAAVGARTSHPFGKRLGLQMDGWVKKDSGAFGFNRAWLVQGYTGLTMAVTPNTSLALGARWSSPITKVTDGRKTEVTWQAGVSRTFR